MSVIFISHAANDSTVAAWLCSQIRRQGYESVFLDFDRDDGIAPGDKWEDVLYRELRGSQVFVALISEQWIQSRWCFAEATHAREKGKLIIGLKLTPTATMSLAGDIQLIDFSESVREEGLDRLWKALDTAIDPRGCGQPDRSRPPYPGLSPFDEKDAPTYFGREDETCQGREALDRLRRDRRGDRRFLVVLGASGSGKSSLVRAGILPSLRRNTENWLLLDPFRPGACPLDELSKAIAKALSDRGQTADWSEIRESCSEKRRNAATLLDLANRLRKSANASHATVLVVVDQLEELLGRREKTPGEEFFALLKEMLRLDDCPYMGLATLRSDFLAEFQTHPVAPLIPYEPFTLEQMQVKSFDRVIMGPAKVYGVEVSQQLTQKMIADTATSDALPLLAFALNQLYVRFGWDGLGTIDRYRDDLGGLEGCLERVAEEALPKPRTAEREKLLRAGLFSVVRLSEEGLFARRTAGRSELSPQVQDALSPLVEARLLVADDESVEVAHEALFRSWRRLKNWLDGNHDFLVWREKLRFRVIEWERMKKDAEALLHGEALKEARRWLGSHRTDLTQQEGIYIARSLKRGRASQGRIALMLALALTAVLIIVSVRRPITWGPMVGGDGGTEFQTACEDTEVLVGISGRHGGQGDPRIFSVAPICSQWPSRSRFGPPIQLGNRYTRNEAGSQGGEEFSLSCPDQDVLKGVDLQQAEFSDGRTYINQIKIRCLHAINIFNGDDDPKTTVVGAAGGDVKIASRRSFLCPKGQLGTTLQGRSGQWVDKLGIGCQVPPRSLAAGCTAVVENGVREH